MSTPITLQQARSALREFMPSFRQRKLEAVVEPRRIRITAVIKSGVDVRPIFELIAQSINEPLR